MLDHIFTDAIGALRLALEQALLERQAIEERLVSDLLLGDLTWQTSYGIPGEGSPPRVQADLTLEWPVWAQTSYRSWCLGESIADPPAIQIEIVLRMQRLREAPDPESVLGVVPAPDGVLPDGALALSGTRRETAWSSGRDEPDRSLELIYEGGYELEEAVLADAAKLDERLVAVGGWISSALVRLSDVPAEYRPPDEEESTP